LTGFKGALRLFPASHRSRAKGVLHHCANTLRSWFSAQITDMAILGLITSLSLWAVGVEFWAVLGLMTTVFAIIPYVGILLVVICATLITLAFDPTMVIWVLVVFAVTQQIEANVILPLLMKSQVELPEVPLLIFILFLGVWFGLLGVFLAPPLFAILRVLYLEFYMPKMEQL
jgi:predicted PurR-regulated permease PerM